MEAIDAAAHAITTGELVVYPTETVYGLGADATNPEAVGAVYECKGRDRSNPLSVAVASRSAVDAVAEPTERTLAFMSTFLPGPITVVCRARPSLPAVLTGGASRVGVRIPAHDLARRLLERTPPITATSANESGGPDARSVDELSPAIRERVAVVLDGGRTEGTPSTVVDVDRGVIHRRGAAATAVEEWLAEESQSDSTPSC